MAHLGRPWLVGLAVVVVGAVIVTGLAVWLSRPDADGPRAVSSDSPRAGWRQLSYDDVRVEVPQEWTFQNSAECPAAVEHWGPSTTDTCGRRPGLSFLDSSTFDTASEPGSVVRYARLGVWSGYVILRGVVVSVQAPDREVVADVLESVEAPGFQPIP